MALILEEEYKFQAVQNRGLGETFERKREEVTNLGY
jgi:hypothetical protein